MGGSIISDLELEAERFANDDKEEEEDQNAKLSRAWAQYEKSLNRRSRAPPGFENIDAVIEKKKAIKEKEEILVSYANGTNTFNLATEPMTVHNVTVSCMVDSSEVLSNKPRTQPLLASRTWRMRCWSTTAWRLATP